MAVIVSDGRLTLTGYVGEHWAYGDEIIIDGFTHPMVLNALAEIDDGSDLTVHINSGGGYAVEGIAIHSVLAQRSGRTDVVIDGEAASAASLIAMVGETIRMSSGAQMMIHDPAGFTFGTVEDHEASIRSLESLATSYARVYSRRSGMTVDEARAIMKAETWYGDEEAVEAGFADEVLEIKRQAIAAFPYDAYARAPQKLVAQAKENGWRLPATRPAVPTAPTAAKPVAETRQAKETPMTDKERADQLAAELEQLKASGSTAASDAVTADRKRRASIMALPEAKGREALASYFADETDDEVEKVQKALAAAPAATPAEEPADPAAEYEANRTQANGVGLGGQPKTGAKGDTSVLKAAVDRRNKRAAR
ncbi:head maturation protease, ClpP-related [Palleronia sp.]|uniref:head maturation protease, ClpP-related n=1 Tax=Palleronia sp. TaxID=1940284 RepID=UPI0035C7DD70